MAELRDLSLSLTYTRLGTMAASVEDAGALPSWDDDDFDADNFDVDALLEAFDEEDLAKAAAEAAAEAEADAQAEAESKAQAEVRAQRKAEADVEAEAEAEARRKEAKERKLLPLENRQRKLAREKKNKRLRDPRMATVKELHYVVSAYIRLIKDNNPETKVAQDYYEALEAAARQSRTDNKVLARVGKTKAAFVETFSGSRALFTKRAPGVSWKEWEEADQQLNRELETGLDQFMKMYHN